MRRKILGILMILVIITLNIGIASVDDEYSSSLVESNNELAEASEIENLKPEKGIVTEILKEVETNTNAFGLEGECKVQYVEIEVTKGPHKGQKIYFENRIDSSFVVNLNLKKGSRVLVFIEDKEDGSIEGYVSELQRDHILLILIIAFLIVLLIVGKIKGLKAFLMLLLTGVVIWKIYIPMLLKGFDPILLSIFSLTIITIITLVVISGLNKKTLVAIIGTLGGLIIAGVLAIVVGNLAQLTGLGNEEAQMLNFIPQDIQLNYRGLLFSGILIGALGAVMDVSMSVASATYEMFQLNPDISKKQLFSSGLNVGRDVMGTMSNTLILAYTGGALPLLLLFQAHSISNVEMINREMIASEVVRALTGSIGLILTVPITAFIAAIIYSKKKQKL